MVGHGSIIRSVTCLGRCCEGDGVESRVLVETNDDNEMTGAPLVVKN